MNQLTTQKNQSIADILENVSLIQRALECVMIKDVHYGIIPGCQKPSLFKPGAEKIASLFRLAVDPVVTDLSTDDEARFRVSVKLTYSPTGLFVGSGIGECSSSEEKYKWRKAVCDEEFDESDETRKREKWSKGKNGAYKIKQVRTNIADVANTILKMAKKRALIDAILTCTAASDIFDQDIEDLPKEIVDGYQEQEQAQKPAGPPPVPKKEEPKKSEPVVTGGQASMIYAKGMAKFQDQATFLDWLSKNYGHRNTKDVRSSEFEAIVAALEA